METFATIMLGIYSISLFGIFLFSMEQAYLAWILKKGDQKTLLVSHDKEFPAVTVQLPVYNEPLVIERLIDQICQLEYPNELLEIQVLDDSTDQTTDLAAAKINLWQAKGIDIKLIKRANRDGFKAGALAHGLETAKGDFIAIFDADFLPPPDFIVSTIGYFEDEKTGMIQTKWTHLNESFNSLTQLQAFGLNGHFEIDQPARLSSGKFINFNGTGGIWRKSCISDAGGWQCDTLTEDLDLSFRAQMKGWEFLYLNENSCPAELPVIVSAVKSQQFRWTKGAAENAMKLWRKLVNSSASRHQKIHGLMQLFSASVYLFLLISAISSAVLAFLPLPPSLHWFAKSLGFFSIGMIGIAYYYRKANQNLSLTAFLVRFCQFILYSMGLSLHNAYAAMEGFTGKKSEFVRTPKFNIDQKGSSWKTSIAKHSFTPLFLAEIALCLVFFCAAIAYLLKGNIGMTTFMTMLTTGYCFVIFKSLTQ